MADKTPPCWADRLTAKGTYFEGVVEDAQIVTQHTNETVTTWYPNIEKDDEGIQY